MRPTLLIIEAGDLPHPLQTTVLKTFPDLFMQAADFGACTVKTLHAQRDRLPGNLYGYDGILVTGSSSMVSDREPWSENLAAWLRNAIQGEVKILGVCYGHQLIAHALGGLVGYHPNGTELGTHEISLTYSGSKDDVFALLGGLPTKFEANLSHCQTVLSPPREATLLGYSIHDPHQILGYSKNVLTLQFHPEFNQKIMRAYVNYILEQSKFENPDINLGAPIEETPVPQKILQRFIDSL